MVSCSSYVCTSRWTHVHGPEDGQLQQRSGEAVTQRQGERRLLAEQLLHGVLQAHVEPAVSLHEVRQAAAGLQERLHLRDKTTNQLPRFPSLENN